MSHIAGAVNTLTVFFNWALVKKTLGLFPLSGCKKMSSGETLGSVFDSVEHHMFKRTYATGRMQFCSHVLDTVNETSKQ